MNYSGAGWTSLQFYSYGAFTFIAKSSNTSGNLISFFTPLIPLLPPLSPLSPRTTLLSYFNSIAGTALTLGVVGAGNGAEQIVFVLGGATPYAFSATSWHLGENILQGTSPLPFDASQVHFSFPSFSLVLPRSLPLHELFHLYFSYRTSTTTRTCSPQHRSNTLWTIPSTSILPKGFRLAPYISFFFLLCVPPCRLLLLLLLLPLLSLILFYRSQFTTPHNRSGMVLSTTPDHPPSTFLVFLSRVISIEFLFLYIHSFLPLPLLFHFFSPYPPLPPPFFNLILYIYYF